VFPESLGASHDGTLYIGSWKGIVYRARPGEVLATPWVRPSPENGLLTILGVLPDDRAGWVWVCSVPAPARDPPAPGTSALMAFDMKTGEQRLNLPLPAPDSVCNDITLAQDGTAYMSDTPNGRIFRVRPRANALELVAKDERLTGIDGIVFSADGILYANSVTSNRIWRIAIDRGGLVGTITQLTLSQPLNGADGFRLIRANDFLLAENAAGRLDEVHISGHRATIKVIKAGLDTPTSAIALGRTIYGVVDRNNLANVYRIFDFASPDTHSPQRFQTSVPQQSLYLMNSPFIIGQARRLAAATAPPGDGTPERIP